MRDGLPAQKDPDDTEAVAASLRLSRGHMRDIRSANRALIFELARHLRTVSSPVLASHTGLSRAAIYGFFDELQRAGVLVEAGVGTSSGGRRPQLLRFEPRTWFAIGIEMGERDLHAVLTDLDGTVLHRTLRMAPGMSPEQVVEATATSVASLQALVPPQRVLGIGFAAPGLVDTDSGIVRTAVSYGWEDVPLAALLAGRTGLSAHVVNRSKAAALGEFHRGAGAGAQHLVYLYAGRGIAAGIVLHGELYAGANSSAGELGHMTILPGGALCECGNTGCLHTLASGAALLARARAKLREQAHEGALLRARCDDDPARLTTIDLAEAAHDGDSIAAPLVREGGQYLGIAVASMIDLLNPDRVILGGPLTAAGSLLLDAVRSEARRRALAVPFNAAQICPTALGADAGSIGAAALVLRQAAERITAAQGSDGTNRDAD